MIECSYRKGGVLMRRFEADLHAPRRARTFVRSQLEPLGEVAKTAELLVSELATNVVKHAPAPFNVEVTIDTGLVRVAVVDGKAVELAVSRAAADETSGRGLMLVEALSERWGVEPHEGGKRVWFELPVR